MNDISQEMEVENLQRIERMSKYEIEKAKQEIMERFGEFLFNYIFRDKNIEKKLTIVKSVS